MSKNSIIFAEFSDIVHRYKSSSFNESDQNEVIKKIEFLADNARFFMVTPN